MLSEIKIWIGKRYRGILNSIAFYPAFIGLLFLLLSTIMIFFDYSDLGKQIKSQWTWLTLKDATTARSIISSIAAGILSLTVFSFSMVMIVLNQAASQMSNRVLDKLIGNRFQQLVLGVYIGTIVYALFLLSTVRDIDSGIYVPALSTYLLILITVIDIFIFIYFLHYITQSVKYEVIIQRIFKNTLQSLKDDCTLTSSPAIEEPKAVHYTIMSDTSGIYEGFNEDALLEFCNEFPCHVFMIHAQGTFVLRGTPLLKIDVLLSKDKAYELQRIVTLSTSESIEDNYFYGFRQLMEIAIKALSPGINDPGTAVVSLRALIQLLAFRFSSFPATSIKNDNDETLIYTLHFSFEQLFSFCILPIWDYGKTDRLIQRELLLLLNQLISLSPNMQLPEVLLKEVKVKLSEHNVTAL